jgi:ABC-type multidrug transport system ATPase subunit
MNLSLAFGRFKVFENLSFKANGGTWLVKGANGSGKTSLCRVMTGLMKPTKGEICWFDDKNLERFELIGRIGFSTPEMGLYEDQTVLENIKLFETITNSKFDDVFGITKFCKKLFGELSSGWKQRLKLLVAFMGDPDLLVLDEPEQHLDDDGVSILTELINRRSKTTIVSTNNPWMKLPTLVDLGSK